MTKIKDLVTVIVDSAFVSFPIDAERYELCAYMNQELNAALGRQQDLIPITDLELKRYYHAMERQIEDALVCARLKAQGEPLNRESDMLARQVLCVPNLVNMSYPPKWNILDARRWAQYNKFYILSSVYQCLAGRKGDSTTVPTGQEG